jgi:uncharacterized protein with PQ loop repeat
MIYTLYGTTTNNLNKVHLIYMCVRKPIGIMNEIKKIFNYTKILYNHDSFRYMHHVSGENIA